MVAFTCVARAMAAPQPPAAAPAEPIVIPIEIRDGFMLLMADVNGHAIPLKFDLGDGDSLVIQKEVLKQLGGEPTGETAKMRGIDGVFEAPLYEVTQVKLGAATFTDVAARVDVRAGDYKPGEQGEKGYLGTGLLKGYLIKLDYPRKEMTLVPRAGAVRESPQCHGAAVPFLQEFNGAPVTEAITDWGRAALWWDTGAPVSAMRQSFTRDAPPTGEQQTVTTQRFVLGAIDMGPVDFSFWAMDLPNFDGFVGFNFFERHAVCVDFPGHRLIVDTSDGAAAAPSSGPAKEPR